MMLFPSDRNRLARPVRGGFTLIELLVVIGLIALLISILVPTISRVRTAAQSAATSAFLTKLQAAVERYQQDFNAYPGPLANSQVGWNVPITVTNTATVAAKYDTSSGVITQTPPTAMPPRTFTPPVTPFVSITGTNNLVLGLLGGLTYNQTTGGTEYNPALVGSGPLGLSPANLRSFPAYIDAQNLSTRTEAGKITGSVLYADAVRVNDCIIPSFVDSYPDRMPILYIRARVGTAGVAGYRTTTDQYDLNQVIGYTTAQIGNVGKVNPGKAHGLRTVEADGSFSKSPPTGKTYYYPYDFRLYVANPNLGNTPRSKDGYILISAGPDRVYGTDDDLTSFGQVAP